MQNVVIVGFGFMGGMHAQVYAKLKQARVVGVVDAAPARARQQAEKIGLDVPVLAELGEALDHLRDVDVVDVCLPTDLHADAALAALKRRKHVFCEKPLCASLKDAQRLRAAVRSGKSRFMVGQCLRFWPEYQAFEKFHRSGQGGRLLSLTMQRRASRPRYSVGDWLNRPERSLGAAVDLHIHDTDYVLHLLGTPSSVSASGTLDKTGWSHIFTNYHFGQVRVQAEGGWNYPEKWGFQMAFQALYEHAAVEYDSRSDPTLRLTLRGRPTAPLAFATPRAGSSRSGAGNVASLGGYYNELRYFIDCLERGVAPRIATLDQGAETLRVVMAELASAGSGKTVKL